MPTEAEIGPRLREIEDRVNQALKHRGLMNDESYDFLLGLHNRLEKYRARTYVSVKQLNWLTRIEQDIARANCG